MIGLAVASNGAQAQTARKFDATLTARTVYDDHVSRSNGAIAGVRGLAQEDVSFSPTLTLDLVQPLGRNAVFLKGSIGYSFYDKNDELNSETIGLDGGVNTSLGPCQGVIGGSFDRRQSELDDLSIAVVENIETTTSVRLNATCGRQVGVRPTFGVVQEWAENSAAARAESDYKSTTGTVGLTYGRPNLGVLTLFGSASRTEFDIPTLTPTGPQDNGYDSYTGGVRFTRQLGARIQGGVNACYTTVKPEAPGVEDFEGFTYGADITYRASSRLNAGLKFSRAVTPSNRQKSSYAVSETYGLDASYRIGTRLHFKAGGTYATNDFEGLGVTTPLLVVTHETVKTFFASIGYDFGERISLTLDANQQERDANVHGFDYTANRYGLSIVAKY